MEIQKDNKGLGTIIKIHGFKDLTPAERLSIILLEPIADYTIEY